MIASKKVCEMIQPGMSAIFGPLRAPAVSNHLQSMAKVLRIPHLETRWDYSGERPNFSLNIHPHPSHLSKAYADLIEKLGWKSLVIIYQDEESLIKLQEVLKLPKSYEGLKITLRQLYTDSNDFRPLLKEIFKSGETRIVLDCEFDLIEAILDQADEIGMINDYHNYLITSLDIERVNISPFKFDNVNITGFRMVDTSRPEVQQYSNEWNFGSRQGRDHPLFVSFDARILGNSRNRSLQSFSE